MFGLRHIKTTGILLGFLASTATIPVVAQIKPITAFQNQFSESLYIAVVNHLDTNEVVHVLRDHMGNRWFRATDLQRWRINLPPIPPINYNGYRYYRLSSISHDKVKINEPQGKIYINFPVKSFKHFDVNFSKTKTTGQRNLFQKPERKHSGMFLNYDFFSQRDYLATFDKNKDSDNQKHTSSTNASFDLGLFNNHGSGVTTFLVKNIAGHGETDQENIKSNNVVRMNTNWINDNPEKMQSWTFGDSVADAGHWGDAVSFGGIKWGTDFSTNPGFYTLPFPIVKGVAVMPSTMDVFVNDSLMGTRKLQTGPFSIDNLPVITGGGDIRLVLKDALGKQTTVNIPYYADSEVLRKGLHEFSLGAGFIRRNLGIDSFNYGQAVVYGTSTYGVTNSLTRQLHTELTPSTQAAGIGASFLLGSYAVANTSIAASASHGDLGGLALIKFSHNRRNFSYGLTTKFTTSNFRTVSLDKDQSMPKIQSQLYTSFAVPFSGSLSFSLIHQENRPNPHPSTTDDITSQPHTTQFGAGYNTSFHGISLSLSGSTNIGGRRNRLLFLTLNTNLGDDRSGMISTMTQNGDTQAIASITKSLPLGEGYGYQVNASTGNNKATNYIGGGVDVQTNRRKYSLRIQHSKSAGTSYQAEISGSLVMMKEHVMQTRYFSDGSFAIVRIPNIAGIPVMFENQKAGTTDKAGYAVIPGLIPYVDNHLEVDAKYLPINTDAKQTKIILTPYRHSGIYGEFNIHQVLYGSANAKLTANKYVPSNASVALNGRKLYDTSVGDNGLIYLQGWKPNTKNRVNIFWPDKNGTIQHCSFSVYYKPGNNGNPVDLGDQICVAHRTDLTILENKATQNIASNSSKIKTKSNPITHIASDKNHPKSTHHRATRIAEEEPDVDEPQINKKKELKIAAHHHSLHLRHA